MLRFIDLDDRGNTSHMERQKFVLRPQTSLVIKLYHFTLKASFSHPGGREIILEHAGMDATTVFQDIGHSFEALKVLSKYQIGELSEKDKLYNSKPKL
ncbi:cytochrome b5-like isoform X2 [Pocillopora damicornis]|uniref:cytochrome b5-like isoform X2 n=1 Tax=Pocillopora damicornis TaxID=46731 RepID=UPI000F556104|nr:cytochrome b5-like isoform X2 [Pocillopora damicornis]